MGSKVAHAAANLAARRLSNLLRQVERAQEEYRHWHHEALRLQELEREQETERARPLTAHEAYVHKVFEQA